MNRERGFLLLGSISVVLSLGGYVSLAANQAETAAKNELLADAIAGSLSQWLPDQLKGAKVPGAAVAVVDNRNIVWEETFGVTSGPESAPITIDTVFCIRSISKSVTALAVLMAVQEGLVDLDTPISEYLSGFIVRSRFDEHPEDLMTLRHLLSLWAGFSHDPPFGIDIDQPGYFKRYIRRISDSWLRFPVGYRHQYSNYGVDLAGFIIQSRSGKPFAQYVQEKVLKPVGMVNSSFDLELVERRKDRAVGHDSRGNVVPVSLPEIPAAGLYSSIRDMSEYLRFHLNGGVVNGRRLLREDLMRQYHSIQFARPDQRTGYCLGLIREVVSTTYCLYHEGGGRGFASHIIIYPELGFGAVLLTNLEDNGLTGILGRRIMNGPIINTFGPIPIADPRLNELRRIDVDDPRVKKILGRYGDSPGTVIGFENGVLGLRMGGDSFSPLTIFDDDGELVGMYGATSEARFLPPFGDRRGSLMTVNRVYSNSNYHYLDFNDAPSDPPGPGKAEWQRYVGEYDVIWDDRSMATVSVTTRDGYLYYRDGRCEEHEPGLFFLYDGETIDFRSSPPTAAHLEIRKKESLLH